MRKGQISPKELGALAVLAVILIFVLPILTKILNAITSGNLDAGLNALFDAFIPLMIFAIFFDLIRRLFG